MSRDRVVLHAPTADALARARSNLRNLRYAEPDVEALILANADGALAALKQSDPDTDAALRLCANTLAKNGRKAPPGVETVDAVIAALLRLQRDGWVYVRA
ncbi:MAG: hypothetical protein AAF684_01045 [Pseudomonadota bacterium]